MGRGIHAQRSTYRSFLSPHFSRASSATAGNAHQVGVDSKGAWRGRREGESVQLSNAHPSNWSQQFENRFSQCSQTTIRPHAQYYYYYCHVTTLEVWLRPCNFGTTNLETSVKFWNSIRGGWCASSVRERKEHLWGKLFLDIVSFFPPPVWFFKTSFFLLWSNKWTVLLGRKNKFLECLVRCNFLSEENEKQLRLKNKIVKWRSPLIFRWCDLASQDIRFKVIEVGFIFFIM